MNGAHVDDQVFLIGRPPLGEYLAFITTMAVGGQSIPQSVLASEWRAANDHLRGIENEEAGWADNAVIAQVDQSQQSLADEIYADPMFQRSYQLVPTEIGIVELDRMVVFQKFINLTYVRSLQTQLGEHLNADQIFRFCLSVDHSSPPVQSIQIAGNSFAFISPSNDFRFVEGRLFSPHEVTYDPQGPVTNILGLILGYGSNFLSAIQIEGRLIIINGSHRAYALRDKGVTHVPCVIQRLSRRDELEVVLHGEVSAKPDLFLKAARPPLLKDYFDPALRKLVQVARKNRLIKVTFGIEQSDIPAS